MSTPATVAPYKPGRSWTFFAAVALGLFFAIYPLYVIRPFRHQGARELGAALLIARWAPWVTLLCAAAAVFHLSRLWRQTSRRGGPGPPPPPPPPVLFARFFAGDCFWRPFSSPPLSPPLPPPPAG